MNPAPEMTIAEERALGITRVTATCKACQGEYEALEYMTLRKQRIATTTGFCFPCSEIEVSRFQSGERERRHADRLAKFQEFCPDLYFNCRPDRLPRPDFYKKVVSPLKDGVGRLLIGPSRSGKSFCGYALLKGLYVELERSCFATTEVQFSHELSKFGKSAAATDFIDRCCNVDFLYIDDLGKAVMTERVVSEMYYVIEERVSNRRPVLASMQIDGKDFLAKLAARSGGDIAEAIVKRLREFCELINFGEPVITTSNVAK